MNVVPTEKRTTDAAAAGELLPLQLEQYRQRISELAKAESLLAGENRILEAVARGVALPEILASLCWLIEAQCEGALCGILLADHTGNRMEHGAAPSLPQSYNTAIHGRLMTSEAGACGMAACKKEQVIVSDIASDCRWSNSEWRALALAHNLRACWSTPIVSCGGTVLGTFALYWSTPGSPAAHDQKLIEQITHLAAVAIERRRVEEAMQTAKARFERILEIAEDAIISVDSNQRILLFNQGAEKVFNYRFEEVAGQPLDLLLPQRVTQVHRQHIETFGKSTEVARLMGQRRAVFGRRKDGSEFPAEASISKLDLAGEVVFTVILRDVTEPKRLEARLRRSEQRLAEGQRLTKTGSWVLDFKTGNTDWSVETCRIFGFSDPPPSPHYSEFRARVRPEDREGVDRGLKESFETGDPRPLQYVFVLPDGTRKNIETVSQRFRDEDGELKLMGTVMDVTERVKAQAALQESEDNLRIAIDTIPGSVWTSLPDGHIDYLNRRWLEYTGLPLDQATGWGWQAAIHPEDLPGLAAYWRTILNTGSPGEYEARLRRHDGAYRWFLFRGVPLFDGQGRLVKWYGTNTDVDDRRVSELLARGQLEAMTGALVGLGRESEPEKFLEHVLRFTCSQLGAHSISFWTLSNQAGCVELQAVFEEDRLYEHPQDSGSAPPQMMLEISTHPVWSPFFQTGEHCVYGRVSSNPPHSRIALDFNGPWYDWQAPVVAHPGTSGMIRRIATLGVTATLCIPMIVSSKVTGMFSIRFLKERTLRREEIELARAMTQQAMLAIQLMRLTKQSRESAVTAERNRMARDLHDTLAQGFTGVIMQLEAAKGASANADPAAVSAHIERAEQLARTSLAEARRSVRAMRSRSLVDGSLSTALDELLKRMTSATGLQADLVVQGECRSLPPDWEEGLLRIAQESLTNTLKYAEARRFRATLSFHTNAVRLQLVDDGRGFDTRAEHEGFGLIGMRERAEQMAGQFVLRSKAGEGTEILIELNQSHAADGNDEKQQAG